MRYCRENEYFKVITENTHDESLPRYSIHAELKKSNDYTGCSQNGMNHSK